MTETKITKAMVLETIKEKCADDATIVEFCDNELALIAKKAAKAKERNAAKKAEGDDLRAAVASVLTTEPQTREDVLAQIEGEDLSVAKIGARLTQLVAAGMATKHEITVDGKKKAAYTLPVDAE